jgi:hypothetical protein
VTDKPPTFVLQCDPDIPGLTAVRPHDLHFTARFSQVRAITTSVTDHYAT